MNASDTPFPPAWWAHELKGSRPKFGTYGRYPSDALPPAPATLRGDWGWLIAQLTHKYHIGLEKSGELTAAIDALLADAAKKNVTIPPEFIAFIRSKDIHSRVRSCTDCYLDVSTELTPSPLGDGFLVHFLVDSQGVVYWYLFLRPGTTDHCVVASPDLYGPEEDVFASDPDPSQIVFAEASIEAFFWRFWIENEIWYCIHEKRPIPPWGQDYQYKYKRIGPV